MVTAKFPLIPVSFLSWYNPGRDHKSLTQDIDLKENGWFYFYLVKHYRQNVAALIVNAKGKLLVCERSGQDGAWQFPQGGVDKGESLRVAMEREVWEEVGYRPEHYSIVEKCSGYRYLYPTPEKKKYDGQEQTYFLLRLDQHAPEPDLAQKNQEFQAYSWIYPFQFELEWAPEFKRDVFRSVMKDFFCLELE